jgi:hypothetical protein
MLISVGFIHYINILLLVLGDSVLDKKSNIKIHKNPILNLLCTNILSILIL